MSTRLILAILLFFTMIPVAGLAQKISPDDPPNNGGPPISTTAYTMPKKVVCIDASTGLDNLYEEHEEIPFLSAKMDSTFGELTIMVLMSKEAETMSIIEIFQNGMSCMSTFGQNIRFFNFENFEKVLRDGKGKPAPPPADPSRVSPGTIKKQISIR